MRPIRRSDWIVLPLLRAWGAVLAVAGFVVCLARGAHAPHPDLPAYCRRCGEPVHGDPRSLWRKP